MKRTLNKLSRPIRSVLASRLSVSAFSSFSSFSSFSPYFPSPRFSASFSSSSPSSPTDSLSSLLVSDVLAACPEISRVSFLPSSLPLLDFFSFFLSQPAVSAAFLTAEPGGSIVGLVEQKSFAQQIMAALVEAESSKSSAPLSVLSIQDFMIPARDLFFLSPGDSLAGSLALMKMQGIETATILSADKEIVGLLTGSFIVDALFGRQSSLPVKAQFIKEILPRLGLPTELKMSSKMMEENSKAFLEIAVASSPHFNKVATGGEDAQFTGSSGGSSLLAVFDGVGSWAFEKGIDAALFSRSLAENTREFYLSHPEAPPMEILKNSWDAVKSQKIPGSSTACVVQFNEKNHLHAANIGDSGFLVLRPNVVSSVSPHFSPTARFVPGSPGLLEFSIVYRSPIQLHYFNCPFQLGISPCGAEDRFDSVDSANELSFATKEGDLLLLATDGLFDNLPEEEILKVINENMSFYASKHTLDHITAVLLERAQKLSRDKTIDSPFALLAKDNNIMWSGGRPDDITIILAKVGRKNN